jgi:hypothetical protein
MNMNSRDKKIVMVIVPLVVVLGYWFVLLAPKREAAASAAKTLDGVKAQLAEAESHASTVEAAKTNFARDYSAVVALGKAIPTSVDMPSLLVQLERASRGTGIEFAGVTVGERVAASVPGSGGGAPDPAAAAPGAQPAAAGTAPSGQPPQSAPGQAAADAQGAANAAESANTPPTGSTGEPGTPAATAAVPAEPASALESVKLEFDFTGSFFELADFFHQLKRFVYVKGEKVSVRGRLMTIDTVSYEADPDQFPALTAKVAATVFLSPKAEGVTAGATPTGPAPAAAAPAPTSTASTGSSSPTPTATATP